MAEAPSYPNPFRSWPSTEEIRQQIQPLAEAILAGNVDSYEALIAACGDLPRRFGCHLPSLTPEERQALVLLSDGYAITERAGWAHVGSGETVFLVRFERPTRPTDVLPEFYYPATPDGTSTKLHVNYLRFRFLWTVGRVVPWSGADLFDRLRSAISGRGGLPPGRTATLATDRQAVEAWADSLNINRPWVLMAAGHIIQRWSNLYREWWEGPDLRRPAQLEWWLAIEGGGLGPDIDESYADRCRLTFTGRWMPTAMHESRANAERRLLTEFLTVAKHELDRIDRMHREAGYARVRKSWRPTGQRSIREHCEMLALYQCAGHSVEWLARTYPAQKSHKPLRGSVGLDRSRDRIKTVRSAIRKLAETVDLPLRSE